MLVKVPRLNFIILCVVGLLAIPNTLCQKKQALTSSDFDTIHAIFNQRFERFTATKVKIKQPFIDTLFTIQQWALANGTATQKNLADFQVFFAYNQLIDNKNIIKSGMQLLAKDNFLEMEEAAYVSREMLSAYDRKGNYRKLLEFYPVHKRLVVKHNNEDRKIPKENYYRLAMVYYKIGDYDRARENFIEQKNFLLENNKLFRAGSMYNNIGLTYEKQHQYNKAIESYTASLNLLEKDNTKDDYFNDDYKAHFKNVVASNIASIKLMKLEFEGVATAFTNELKSSIDVNEPRTIIQAYMNLSELNLLNKDFEKSQQLLDSAFVRLKTYYSLSLKSRGYLLKAKQLLATQKIIEAEAYFLKNIAINDSIKNAKVIKDYEEASVAFNLDVVKDDLEMSKKLVDQKSKTTLYQWIAIIITSIAGLVFFALFISIKRKNKAIKQNKKELAKALKKNEVLLQEISHRIKNNLQIINGILELKQASVEGIKNKAIFSETQQYVDSMSFIHQHLYEQNANNVLNMQEYLTDLVNAVVANYKKVNIDVVINANDIIMSVEKATPFGLIVCELVTNSAKHAFENEGNITIDLTYDNELYHFKYADNGKGYDIHQSPKSGQLGLNLISMLAEELDTTTSKSVYNGFHFTMNFT